MINARAFLGKEGFVFDKKPSQIDRLFLKEFSSENADAIREIWEAIHHYGAATTKLYKVPKTAKQANILWSYDRARYVATFDWLQSELAHWQPDSIVEMGCGSGNFLRFVRANFPQMRLKGVDVEETLVAIAKSTSDIDVDALDYLSASPTDGKFAAVLCNFGFDLSRFSPSTTPHSTEQIGQSPFCRGCSDDFASQFDEYVKCWRAWGSSDAKLLLTGRLPSFGHVRGAILAAAAHGWFLSLNRSRSITIKGPDGEERFPAMVFTVDEIWSIDGLLHDAEKIFRYAVAAVG